MIVFDLYTTCYNISQIRLDTLDFRPHYTNPLLSTPTELLEPESLLYSLGADSTENTSIV
jgi:hypothetical protein